MRQLALLFCCWFTAAIAAEAATWPVHLVLELSDQAAHNYRTAQTMPAQIVESTSESCLLKPVFCEPPDKEGKELWHRHGLNRWFRLLAAGEDLNSLAERLQADGEILSVEVLEPIRPFTIPNDYTLHYLWGLEQMDLPDAWDIHHSDSQIIIATIDTGCEIDHPDLAANQWVNPGEDLNADGTWDEADNNGVDDDENGFIDDIIGWDFVSVSAQQLPEWVNLVDGEDIGPRDNEVFPDFFGHGTHVAGIAAAVTDNGTGVASSSWNVYNMPLRFMFSYLDNNGNVTSLAYLDDAAAGNNNNTDRNYPAAYGNVLAITATDAGDRKAEFASYGDWISFAAPGVNIWSTMSNNQFHAVDYATWQGTSMAAPMVSAVVGLILNYYPGFTVDDLMLILLSSCENIDEVNPDYAGLLGVGRLNAQIALQTAASLVPETNAGTPREYAIESVYPNPFNPSLAVAVSLPRSSFLTVQVFDVLGRTVGTVTRGRYAAGAHTLHFNPSELTSGVYFVRAVVPGLMNEVRKVALLR